MERQSLAGGCGEHREHRWVGALVLLPLLGTLGTACAAPGHTHSPPGPSAAGRVSPLASQGQTEELIRGKLSERVLLPQAGTGPPQPLASQRSPKWGKGSFQLFCPQLNRNREYSGYCWPPAATLCGRGSVLDASQQTHEITPQRCQTQHPRACNQPFSPLYFPCIKSCQGRMWGGFQGAQSRGGWHSRQSRISSE